MSPPELRSDNSKFTFRHVGSQGRRIITDNKDLLSVGSGYQPSLVHRDKSAKRVHKTHITLSRDELKCSF